LYLRYYLEFFSLHINGSNEFYANPHVLGIGDRAVFVGAIDIILIIIYVLVCLDVRVIIMDDNIKIVASPYQ
jgi:hypothetical protein